MSQKSDNTPRRRHGFLRRGETGQTIIIVAFAAIALFAMIGLAIDAGRLYITKAELSRSVDAAALSGILEFNGTVQGLANGEAKAEEYFDQNEPGDNVTRDAIAYADDNEMTVDATKTVNLIFMRVLGIDSATVSAHARAGFGTQYLDAVMVLDATPSMAGTPLVNAKNAAIAFKDILLGSNPQGNALVGVTPFRGCYNPPKTTSDCIGTSQISGLSYNNATLNGVINAITASTGGSTSATNVCTGLAKGWDILTNTVSGVANHNDDVLYPGNQQVLVLLSDGDNAYWGTQSYQDPYYTGSGAYNTSSSPTGTTIGGTVYPCQPIDASAGSTGAACPAPWNNPAISSTYPCYKGVHTPVTTIAADSWDGPSNNCPSSWTSGTGAWASPSAWTVSSSPAPSRVTSASPLDTGCHARLGGTATICRAIDLSAYPAGRLYFNTKDDNTWESADDAFVRANTTSCAAASGWTNLWTRTGSNIPQNYSEFDVSLNSYAGAVVYIQFQGSMSATDDYWYLDNIWVEAGSEDSSNGYLNGNDNSSPQDCNTQQKPRERQMDVRTLALANAMKAQGVEIYVVAFAGGVPNCHLGQNVTYDDSNPSHCGLITDNSSYPIGASGADGSTNPATTNPNVRLLQCIASSTDGTRDHYFYASDSDELEDIFTTIATQIAHRLIE